MWSVFHRKTQITIIVTGAIVIVVALQTIIEWITGSWPSALKLSSVAIFILATLMVGIFNFTWRWLWRKFPVLGRTIFPDLNGTWKGTLQTTWKDPNTGLSPGPIETTVWIRQDLLSFSVKQQTKESPSWSTRIFPYADVQADRYQLWYSYQNRPHANVAPVSPEHEGVCLLEMNVSLSEDRMRGQYYTSRSTGGNMEVHRVSRSIQDIQGRESWPGGSEFHHFRER
jgi:hypothetical protein